MTDLLCIPLKKATEVDIAKPLKNTIATLYSTADAPQDLSADIQELAYMRGQAVSKTLDNKSPAALELLYKYYDQIASLETKIPPQEVQIAFKWKDAFDKGSLFGGRVSLSVSSLAYEKVCILFNIAALQSQVGAHTRIGDSDQELKNAAKLFQQSSGIFAYLKTVAATTMGGQEPTPDMTGDATSALSSLMVAQAQEIFVKKAIADKMKDGTVARLCIQCEDMYAEALKQLQRESVKHLWEKDWVPNVAGKQAAYSALAQYFQSQVCGEKKAVGEQITRLQLSIDTLKQAQQRSGNPNFFSEYSNKATRALAQAKKDNDFIYHERVLEVSGLSPIDKVSSARLAKVLPLADKMAERQAAKELFSNLVPVQVHQAIATCEVRKTEMTGAKVNQLREASSLLNCLMASLNLPAAIEESASGAAADVPQSLREKAKFIQTSGGYIELMKSVTEIPESVQRNKEILDEAERLLREEEESDNQLRSQLKEKWTRTSSDKLNATFKTNASRYREIINNALAADEVVRGKLATHEQAIQMLSRGEGGLGDVIPKSEKSSNTGSASAKDNLKTLMVAVEQLKREREGLESQLKNLTFDLKTPFLKALAQDGAINEPVMSVELLGKATAGLDNQVRLNLEKQEQLITEIQTNSEEYFGKKANSSDTLSRRDTIMRSLAEGYDAFVDLQNNLKEGKKFYNDLTQLLLAFQNKISDYCFARKTEKEELLRDVTRDASSANPNPPPPRPPAPVVAVASTNANASAPPPPYNPYAGAPQQQQGPGGGGGAAPPYPPSYPTAMPYPQQPYPFTPMPATFNPYATFPLPSHYPMAYPQQPMGYAPNPYGGYPMPPQQQQQQQPPPQ